MVVNSLKREVYSRYKPTKGGSNSSSSRSGLSVKRRNSVVSPGVGVKGARVFPFFFSFFFLLAFFLAASLFMMSFVTIREGGSVCLP